MKRCILILVVVTLTGAGFSAQLLNVSSFSLPQQNDRPELVLQRGHSLGVSCAAFAPDGSWVASAGADNSIILWQTSSGRELRTLNGHQGAVRSVAVSADGRWLASGSNDRTVKVWDVNSGQVAFTLSGHSGPIAALAFSLDGQWLTSGSDDKTIKIWGLTNRKELITLSKHTAPLSVLVFGRSGASLVSAANQEVIVWDTKTWQSKQTFRQSTASVKALALSEDERSIALGVADGRVLIWHGGSDNPKFSLKHNPSNVLALNFAPDGTLSAIHSDGGIDVWDTNTGKEKRSVPGDVNRQQFIFSRLSSDSSIFAAGDGSRDLTIQDTVTGKPVSTLKSHSTAVNSIAFSLDGNWFASACNDSSIRLWQVATGRELPRLMGHTGYVTAIAFSPDSNLLASGSNSGEVKMWDLTTTQSSSLPSHSNGVNSLAFSPDGKVLAVVGLDQNVALWDLPSRQARSLIGHTQEITSVVFAPKGDALISAGRDKTIRIWNVKTGTNKSLTSPSEINGLAVNSDGSILASANADNTVRLWDLTKGEVALTLPSHSREVLSVKFSPDDKSLVSASADHSAIIWNLQSGKPLYHLGSLESVTGVVFTKDSRWILTGSEDGAIMVWNSAAGTVAATLVSIPNSDDWLVATPDGLFDGSPESWNLMLWRFGHETFNVVPIEAYFNEFYKPGVLSEILAGENPKPVTDIAQKDRRQPLITLKNIGENGARTLNIDLEVAAAPPDKDHPATSGARDLRLFRNGLLVRVWPGDLLRTERSTRLQTSIPIVAGDNRLTAYAFNTDNIKSPDANLFVQGAQGLKRQGAAYLLLIGVEQYENTDYNLRYSTADVTEMEAQLRAQQEKLGKYNPIVTVPLVNAEATKANILLALDRLSGTNMAPLSSNAPPALARIKPAQPEDAVLIYFSGHGTSANNRFYLIPHDMGYKGPRTKLDAIGMKEILAHGVSDEELESALQPLDVDQLLLVIDACYSGQAVESTEKRRGPMNTKGLAQLAYEKGIYVLTASQNFEVAFEAEVFKHSYLAYALLEEGLKRGEADTNRDGNIFLREWFDYANNRVPQLRKLRFKRKELVEEEADEQKVQRPRIFYTREEGAKMFLIGRVPTN